MSDTFKPGDWVFQPPYEGLAYKVIAGPDESGRYAIEDPGGVFHLANAMAIRKAPPTYPTGFRNVYPWGFADIRATADEADERSVETRIGVLEHHADGTTTMHPVTW